MKSNVVGAVSKPTPEKLVRMYETFDDGQSSEIRRQFREGSMTIEDVQALIDHRQPLVPAPQIDLPQVVIPNLRKTGQTLADWLKARETLHTFFTGETIVLTDNFAFTEEELASTTLMPAFRSAGATNRMAVDWKKKMGETVPHEEVDVMGYKNSGGPEEPELYLLNRSLRPDEDTLGDSSKSPDGLIQVPNKLWIGLYSWSDADTLHAAITGKHLDPETRCWFPEDRLPGGGVARGGSRAGQAGFFWGYAGRCDSYCGARSAKRVPLKPQT